MSTLWDGREIGEVLVEDSVELSRDSLVRYAGASGDFNPIHYRDDVAKLVGLEGVLAHGMLTMGLAVAPVSAWLGDRGFVSSYQVRFTKPVYIPAAGSVTVAVSISLAKVQEISPQSATLALAVTTCDGTTVLGKAFVVVSANQVRSRGQENEVAALSDSGAPPASSSRPQVSLTRKLL